MTFSSSFAPPVSARPNEIVFDPNAVALPEGSPSGLEAYWEEAQRPAALAGITEENLDVATELVQRARAYLETLDTQIGQQRETIVALQGARATFAEVMKAFQVALGEGSATGTNEELSDGLSEAEARLSLLQAQQERLGHVVVAMDERLLQLRRAKEEREAKEAKLRREREEREQQFSTTIQPSIVFLIEQGTPDQREFLISGLEQAAGVEHPAGEKEAQQEAKRVEAQNRVDLFLGPTQQSQVDEELKALLEEEQGKPRLVEKAGKLQEAEEALDRLRKIQGVIPATISDREAQLVQARDVFQREYDADLRVALERVAMDYLQAQPPQLAAILQPIQARCVDDPAVLMRVSDYLFRPDYVARYWTQALSRAFIEGNLDFELLKNFPLARDLLEIFTNANDRLRDLCRDDNSLLTNYGLQDLRTFPQSVQDAMAEKCRLPQTSHTRALVLAEQAWDAKLFDRKAQSRGTTPPSSVEVSGRKLSEALTRGNELGLPCLRMQWRENLGSLRNSCLTEVMRASVVHTAREAVNPPSPDQWVEIVTFLFGSPDEIQVTETSRANSVSKNWILNVRDQLARSLEDRKMAYHQNDSSPVHHAFALFQGGRKEIGDLLSGFDACGATMQGTADQDWAALEARFSDLGRLDRLPQPERPSVVDARDRFLQAYLRRTDSQGRPVQPELDCRPLCEVRIEEDTSCLEGVRARLVRNTEPRKQYHAEGVVGFHQNDSNLKVVAEVLEGLDLSCLFAEEVKPVADFVDQFNTATAELGRLEGRVRSEATAIKQSLLDRILFKKPVSAPARDEKELQKEEFGQQISVAVMQLRRRYPQAFPNNSVANACARAISLIHTYSLGKVDLGNGVWEKPESLDQRIQALEHAIRTEEETLNPSREGSKTARAYSSLVELLDRHREGDIERRLRPDKHRLGEIPSDTSLLNSLKRDAQRFLENCSEAQGRLPMMRVLLKLLKDLQQESDRFSREEIAPLRASLIGDADHSRLFVNFEKVMKYCREHNL